MIAHTFIDEAPEAGPAVSALKAGKPVETAVAGPWRLVWTKFARNRVALVAGAIILILFLIGLFAEFLAPTLPDTSRPQFTNAPPQEIRLFATQPDGSSQFLLHVTGDRKSVV